MTDTKMKGFVIEATEDDKVEITPCNLNIDEFIVLAGTSLELSLRAAYNQMEGKLSTEKDKKELRASLYDRLILLTTEIAQAIYPEYIDLYEKTPEAFMADLDKKVKALNDAIKTNKQAES